MAISMEFLIQKEGDRSWLPLKMLPLAIEEGIYRILANSNRANILVEIRLSHQKIEQGKIIRTSQSYSRRSNSEGLIMVLPFTNFQPGMWEIRCSSDIMSELFGESWQQSIQLQVLSNLKVISKEENQPTPNHQSSMPKVDDYLNQLDQLLKQEIEPMLQVTEVSQSTNTEQVELLDNDTPSVSVTNNPIVDQDELFLGDNQTTSLLHLDLPEPTKMTKNLRIQSYSNQVLPPKINRSGAIEKIAKSPQLPKIAFPQPIVAQQKMNNSLSGDYS